MEGRKGKGGRKVEKSSICRRGEEGEERQSPDPPFFSSFFWGREGMHAACTRKCPRMAAGKRGGECL